MIRGDRGFTIVESMIFLVVTAALFSTAILLLNGQQKKGQFTQATRDFESKVRDLMNDIETGLYGEAAYTCDYGPAFAAAAPGVNSQGTNKNCIFAGKVVHFGGCATCKSQYHIYTLVGNRTVAAGSNSEVTSLKSSNPKVVDGAMIPPSPNVSAPALTEDLTIPYGIEILSAKSGGSFVSAVVFGNTFSGFIDSSNSNVLEIRKIVAPSLSGVTATSKLSMVGTINGIGSAMDNTVAIDVGSNPVIICLGNVNDENYARLEIGGTKNNGVLLSVVNNYNVLTGDCS